MSIIRRHLLIGTTAWIGWVAYTRPSPLEPTWGEALLLLAPLVLVPLFFHLAGELGIFGKTLDWQLLRRTSLPASLSFAIAYVGPKGWLAMACALPWACLTAWVAGRGVARFWQGGRVGTADFCLAAGMAYFAVAGFWAFADRLGWQPFGYDPQIVFLTVAHFHYAGLLLPVLAGLAIGRSASVFAQMTGYLTVAGIFMVAVGILATQHGLGTDWEMAAAIGMALAGACVAGLYLRKSTDSHYALVSRALWSAGALCLLSGMALAGLYGSRFIAPAAWLDIPTMRALHGTANSVGFCLPVLLGWHFHLKKATAQS